jgi:hypothetical protein
MANKSEIKEAGCKMFRRLSLRIVLITLSAIAICTILIGIFSFQWAKRTVQSEFIEVSSTYYRNSGELLSQYMNYVEESAKVMLNNPVVVRAVRQPQVSMELQPVLDNLSAGQNLKLAGISIYKTDGTVYSLSRMSNMPSLQALQQDERIRSFEGNSAQKSMWLFRSKDNVGRDYANSYSPNGALSYLLKTFDDSGSLLGIMIIDLDANKLFDFFSTDNALFRQSNLFLVRDGKDVGGSPLNASKEVPDAGDLAQITKDPAGSFISSRRDRLMLFHSVLGSSTKIVMDIPLRNATSKLHALPLSIVLLTLLSSTLAVLLAYLLKTSIVRPLTQLYKRIRAFI